MGFWNALSVLAPIAPAMSDARDIRAQRAQDAQDLELKKAQAVTQQMASQVEQQRLRAGTQPLLKPGTQPEFNPDLGTFTQPEWDPDKKAYVSRSVPGVTPQQQEKFQLESLKRNREAAKAIMPTDTSNENLDYLAYTLSGLNPPTLTKLSPTVTKTPQNDTRFIAITGRPESTWSQDDQEFVRGYKNMIATKVTQPGVSRMNALIPVAYARAQADASQAVDHVIDDYGNFVDVPRSAAIGAYKSGNPYRSANVPGTMQSHAILAQSAIDQVNRMQAILRVDPNLTGPGNGQLTRLQTFFGAQDPDAQEFLISSLLASEHGVAVFGGRNIHTIQDLNNALGSMKANPAALNAALEVVKSSMARFANAGGRLGPKAAAAPAAGAGAPKANSKQHSLRTAMALPAMKGKTASQVKAALESYGYEVVP